MRKCLQFVIAGLQIVRHLTRSSANVNFSKFSFIFCNADLTGCVNVLCVILEDVKISSSDKCTKNSCGNFRELP